MTNFWTKLHKPILVLAPMAGISDLALRRVCHEQGADVVYTEMTSIDALYYDSEKTFDMLKTTRKERPVVLQLFGKRPELAAKAVKYVKAAGFSGIDLNFGCPARKVVKHGGGISLLKNLNLCQELVHAVCEAATIPVSVKTRVSINNGNKTITVFDFLDKIKDLPVSTLMLHGRTYEQEFSGEVNYEVMKQVKQVFKGTVIGNGGLNTPEDVKKMLELTGVDGVAIARGIYGRPWLFAQIREYLDTGKYEERDMKQIKKILLCHAKYNYDAKGDHGIIEMRKQLCWYFRGFPNSAEWRSQFVRVETLGDIKAILKRI